MFFDALGIEWQYEPEGFRVGLDGDRPYLPDFFLPEHGTWVEVKGNIDDEELLPLIVDAVDFGHLPARCTRTGEISDNTLDYYNDSPRWHTSFGLLLLGEIPNPAAHLERFGNSISAKLVIHDLFILHKGVVRQPSYFSSGKRLLKPYKPWEPKEYYAAPLGRRGISGAAPLYGHKYVPYNLREGYVHMPKVLSAYNRARQARFEHEDRDIMGWV